jgi:hypothetical protein
VSGTSFWPVPLTDNSGSFMVSPQTVARRKWRALFLSNRSVTPFCKKAEQSNNNGGMPIAIQSADAAECLLATIHIAPAIIIPTEMRYASILSLIGGNHPTAYVLI